MGFFDGVDESDRSEESSDNPSPEEMIENMGDGISMDCPIDGCDYKHSSAKSVARHVSGSSTGRHLWKFTEYAGWKDFVRKHGEELKYDSKKYPDPDELADRYEATLHLKVLLEKSIETADDVEPASDHPMVFYYSQVDRLLDELGTAQAQTNDFSMKEYRKGPGHNLPTLETVRLSDRELELLPGDEDELKNYDRRPAFDSGEALPLFVEDMDEVEAALQVLQEFETHIPGGEDIIDLESVEDAEKEIGSVCETDTGSVRVLHVADTHIGFSNRREADRGYVPSDEVDCLQGFKEVVDTAVSHGVDAVVHSGEVFDHCASREHIREFRKQIQELEEAGISFHFVFGNHCFQHSGRGGEEAAAHLIYMDAKGEIDLLNHEPTVLGEGVVSLYGVGYSGIGVKNWDFFENQWDSYDTLWWENPDLEFGEYPDSSNQVLCAHGDFRSDGKHMPAGELLSRSNIEFDKMLFGDLHHPIDGVDGVADAHYAGPVREISRGKNDFQPKVKLYEFSEENEVEVDSEELRV